MVDRMRLIKWVVILILSTLMAAWVMVGTGRSDAPTLAAIPVIPARPDSDLVLMVNSVFVLTVVEEGGRLAYLGVSPNIEDQLNPDLVVKQGEIVELVLLNTSNQDVDISLLGYDLSSPVLPYEGMGASMIFDAWDAGEFVYCSRFPELARRGLRGRFLVLEDEEQDPPGNAPIQTRLSSRSGVRGTGPTGGRLQ